MIKNIVTISLMIFIIAVVGILGVSVLTNSKSVALQSNQNAVLPLAKSPAPVVAKKVPVIIKPAPVATPITTPAPSGITAAQVATHNNSSDCWLIINNVVYNATSYMPTHPGGPGQIIPYCGQDATSVFSQIHSQRAWNILNNYYVGNFTR